MAGGKEKKPNTSFGTEFVEYIGPSALRPTESNNEDGDTNKWRRDRMNECGKSELRDFDSVANP